jgi:hypothetical protein
MTLAIILLFGVLGVSPATGHIMLAPQAQSASDQQATKPPQNSATTPSANSTQAATGKAQSANTSTPPSTAAKTAKKPGKGQQKSSVNCNSTAPRNTSAKGSKPNNSAVAAGKNSAAASPCPPKKVIVRQGSTSDPSIEVVGGAEGRQASDERNTAIQMLETTETNLKKVEGTQLDSNQQDMVKQVREFMDQSRAATSAGDLDQARTLALKAQLLSEELVRTEK